MQSRQEYLAARTAEGTEYSEAVLAWERDLGRARKARQRGKSGTKRKAEEEEASDEEDWAPDNERGAGGGGRARTYTSAAESALGGRAEYVASLRATPGGEHLSAAAAETEWCVPLSPRPRLSHPHLHHSQTLSCCPSRHAGAVSLPADGSARAVSASAARAYVARRMAAAAAAARRRQLQPPLSPLFCRYRALARQQPSGPSAGAPPPAPAAARRLPPLSCPPLPLPYRMAPGRAGAPPRGGPQLWAAPSSAPRCVPRPLRGRSHSRPPRSLARWQVHRTKVLCGVDTLPSPWTTRRA
jgi:hypothetical protein